MTRSVVLRYIVFVATQLSYIVFVATQLKWAWDYLLHISFFQPSGIILREYVDVDDDLSIKHYKAEKGSRVECAVCLCGIDDGDEVRELSCNHLFHRVCLDRWLGYGHVTCPLCRNNVKPPRLVAESQEVILLDLYATGSRDRHAWWLR